jgi:hypothetical protein
MEWWVLSSFPSIPGVPERSTTGGYITLIGTKLMENKFSEHLEIRCPKLGGEVTFASSGDPSSGKAYARTVGSMFQSDTQRKDGLISRTDRSGQETAAKRQLKGCGLRKLGLKLTTEQVEIRNPKNAY